MCITRGQHYPSKSPVTTRGSVCRSRDTSTGARSSYCMYSDKIISEHPRTEPGSLALTAGLRCHPSRNPKPLRLSLFSLSDTHAGPGQVSAFRRALKTLPECFWRGNGTRERKQGQGSARRGIRSGILGYAGPYLTHGPAFSWNEVENLCFQGQGNARGMSASRFRRFEGELMAVAPGG